MDYFKDLNKYLDQGYKLTNTNCPICKFSIIFNPQNKQFFCTKCKLPVKIESYQEQDEDLSEGEQVVGKIEEESFKWHQEKPSQKGDTSTQSSQKLGQKLLQGWCMLESTCDACYTPIMRSKSQEYVCVTCNWSKFIKPNDEAGLAKIGQAPQPPPSKQPIEKELPSSSKASIKIENSPSKGQNDTQELNPTQNILPSSQTKPKQSANNLQSSMKDFPETKQSNQPQNYANDLNNNSIQVGVQMIQKLFNHYNQRLEKLIQTNSESEIDELLMNQLTRLFELEEKTRSKNCC